MEILACRGCMVRGPPSRGGAKMQGTIFKVFFKLTRGQAIPGIQEEK